jgi:hypothetical protein
MIPILISANVFVENAETNKKAAKTIFFIFSL